MHRHLCRRRRRQRDREPHGARPHIAFHDRRVPDPHSNRRVVVQDHSGSRRLAERRVASSAVRVEHVGLDGQSIPLASDSCDAALSTFTLCTVPDSGLVLSELRRVVRPGGELHFLEHGLAPDPDVVAWQRRLEPLQRRLADGCHLTRDIPVLIADAGFVVDRIEQRYAKGPRPWSWFTTGVALNPG